MILRPDTSAVLTEALRPPPGHEVDVAVATAYSMNLTAMLIAPMTFAFAEMDDASGIEHEDPAQLLDAVQRYLGRTTVFCQAAGIHIPKTYSRIHDFLDSSVFEVEPPRDSALFHPKLWAVRYRSVLTGDVFHRVIVGSRNLTLDSSWDTALVLDETAHGAIEGSPASDAVESLIGMVIGELGEEREESIRDLAGTLRGVRFDVPEPFTGGRLLPLGFDDQTGGWSFPTRPRKILAISPFLSRGTLERIHAGAPEATLLTRAAAADLLGERALSDWDVHVLAAELDSPDESPDNGGAEGALDSEDAPSPLLDLTGLHAKTIIIDGADGESVVVTGSANLTGSAWNGNVEFDAVLTGPTGLCGVDAVLDAGGKGIGLRTIMEPYTPPSEASEDPRLQTDYELETFHRSLARAEPRLDITLTGDETVTARLFMDLPEDCPGETKVWPLTAPALRRQLASEICWELSVDEVTPFLAVETTSGDGATCSTRRSLLKVKLVGHAIDREQRALASMLGSRERVLRYLALLLGLDDPVAVRSHGEQVDSLSSLIDGAPAVERLRLTTPFVLFEPLVRAAGNDIDRILSVRTQVQAVLDMPGAEDLIPPEFLQLWDVVLAFSVRAGKR